MKSFKNLKDFKIEELEQRLEMDGGWTPNSSTGAPTAAGDLTWENIAIGIGLFLLFIIII